MIRFLFEYLLQLFVIRYCLEFDFLGCIYDTVRLWWRRRCTDNDNKKNINKRWKNKHPMGINWATWNWWYSSIQSSSFAKWTPTSIWFIRANKLKVFWCKTLLQPRWWKTLIVWSKRSHLRYSKIQLLSDFKYKF